MPTTKQKKLRAERETAKRRRLHGRSAQSHRVQEPVYGTVLIGGSDAEDIITVPSVTRDSLAGFAAANPPSMQNLVADVAPSRAKCPACGFSQKVRKDGTIGSHGATPGSSLQCEGTGQPWTTASPA